MSHFFTRRFSAAVIIVALLFGAIILRNHFPNGFLKASLLNFQPAEVTLTVQYADTVDQSVPFHSAPSLDEISMTIQSDTQQLEQYNLVAKQLHNQNLTSVAIQMSAVVARAQLAFDHSQYDNALSLATDEWAALTAQFKAIRAGL